MRDDCAFVGFIPCFAEGLNIVAPAVELRDCSAGLSPSPEEGVRGHGDLDAGLLADPVADDESTISELDVGDSGDVVAALEHGHDSPSIDATTESSVSATLLPIRSIPATTLFIPDAGLAA